MARGVARALRVLVGGDAAPCGAQRVLGQPFDHARISFCRHAAAARGGGAPPEALTSNGASQEVTLTHPPAPLTLTVTLPPPFTTTYQRLTHPPPTSSTWNDCANGSPHLLLGGLLVAITLVSLPEAILLETTSVPTVLVASDLL